MKSDSLDKALRDQWIELASKFSADVSLIDKLFIQLKTSYSSSGRHYHNFEHIQSLLTFSRQFESDLVKTETVNFAIFYHDIVYDVLRSNNEKKSADIARRKLSLLNVPSQIVLDTTKFIQASKTHILNNPEVERDLAFFLDFDLSILASSWKSYEIYTAQIRKEYAIYPDAVYFPGRRKFLLTILSRPNIFNSTIFRSQYEQRARKNIRKELEILEPLHSNGSK